MAESRSNRTRAAGGRASSRRGARRRGRRSASIGAAALTPMIDVVFLLMLYFLLVGELTPPDAILPLALPAEAPTTERAPAADPFALPERPAIVRIESTGPGPDDARIEVEEPSLGPWPSIDAFAAALAGQPRERIGRETRIILAPRANTRWEHTLRTLETLRARGFDDLAVRAPNEGAP